MIFLFVCFYKVWLFLVRFTSKFVQQKHVVKHLTPDGHSHSQSWKQAPTLGLQSWAAVRGSQHCVSMTCQAVSASLVQSFQMQSVWQAYVLAWDKGSWLHPRLESTLAEFLTHTEWEVWPPSSNIYTSIGFSGPGKRLMYLEKVKCLARPPTVS